MAELMFIVCSDVVPEIPTEDLTSVEPDDMTVADAEQSVDKFVKRNKKRKSSGMKNIVMIIVMLIMVLTKTVFLEQSLQRHIENVNGRSRNCA